MIMISDRATTEPAPEEQEAAERQEITVHYPGQRGLREAEVVPDGWEGNVHDRPVEDDHDVPESENVEREPAAADVTDHGCPSRSRGMFLPNARTARGYSRRAVIGFRPTA
jgi:hypothetical protein